MSKSKSNLDGELSAVEEKEPLVTQSSNAAPRPNTSDMSANSQTHPTSQIGFQPTKALEIDETTTNAHLVTAFAAKLGALVEWRRLTLADGRGVIALVFPLDSWEIDPVRSELRPVNKTPNGLGGVGSEK